MVTQQAAVSQANGTELLASSGAFRIPPPGTIATYQCKGGNAKTVEYVIDAVDGDTVTVRVTGDGKDHGTFRRKAWQMVGTTLFEESNYRGKPITGIDVSDKFAVIGTLQTQQKLKSKPLLQSFISLAEPPLSWDDVVARGSDDGFATALSATEFSISIEDAVEQTTDAFGRQSLMTILESRKATVSWEGKKWDSHLRTVFAPALGFAISQKYRDSSRYKASCKLRSITGPGASYIALGPLKPGSQLAEAAQTKPSTSAPAAASRSVTPLSVQKSVASDTEPPVLIVVTAVAANGPVVAIEGRVEDKSPIAELSVQGVPVQIDADGSFVIRRGVPVGESEILVAAVDVWGNVAEQSVRVSRTLSQTAPKSIAPKTVASQPTTQISSVANSADTTPPVIETMGALKTNFEVETISGQVSDASEVVSFTIDGESVAIGADGAFSAERKLPVGKSQ